MVSVDHYHTHLLILQEYYYRSKDLKHITRDTEEEHNMVMSSSEDNHTQEHY